ncbi:MAG: hypothetical protein V5A72_03350 [Candidatus Nanohaloarchaea archaeon]
MSDELFPDYEEDGSEDNANREEKGQEGLLEKAKSFILVKIGLESSEAGESEDEESSFNFVTDNDSYEEDEEESELTWKSKLDRFTLLVVGIEVMLLTYLLLAIIGFAPFF